MHTWWVNEDRNKGYNTNQTSIHGPIVQENSNPPPPTPPCPSLNSSLSLQNANKNSRCWSVRRNQEEWPPKMKALDEYIVHSNDDVFVTVEESSYPRIYETIWTEIMAVRVLKKSGKCHQYTRLKVPCTTWTSCTRSWTLGTNVHKDWPGSQSSRHSWRPTQIFPADDPGLSLILSFQFQRVL